ncbi:hypothetical protein F4604DRAFT_1681664 [Suillus subluteus]|nr:hypothetical protein F4604DRAFT_1681664 [Suillus subluteus]
MSQAHHQEILDDHMWNLNWKTSLVLTLLQKYKHAKKGIDDTKVPFEKLTCSLEVSKVLSWEKDEKQAMDQCKEHLDIYQLNIDKVVSIYKMHYITFTFRAVVEEKQQKVVVQISKFHETVDAMSDGIEVDADMEEQGHKAADLKVAKKETGEEVAAEGMCFASQGTAIMTGSSK